MHTRTSRSPRARMQPATAKPASTGVISISGSSYLTVASHVPLESIWVTGEEESKASQPPVHAGDEDAEAGRTQAIDSPEGRVKFTVGQEELVTPKAMEPDEEEQAAPAGTIVKK